jgi:lysophospholipase L1-like esterase
VGDSLTAGFQNGSLLDSQQPNGWAAQVAKQANYKIVLPLIAPPGAPAVLQLVSVGPPPVVQQTSGITTGRDNPSEQPTDLAVPGHLLHDLLYTGPTAIPTTDEEIITDLILGLPLGDTKPQASEAVALKPTTLFIWIGNNDALVADDTGMPSSMTPIADFTKDFKTLMQGAHAETGAALVVANIPDVTSVPYLTSGLNVMTEAANQSGLSFAQIQAILGIQDTDLVNATGLQEVQTDLQKLAASQPTTPLDHAGYLTAAEVTQIQQQIDAYNQVIAAQTAAVNGILIDIHSLYESLKSGMIINGYQASNAFLGGLFSLDGIHPTNTGYALIGNAFIDAINGRLTNNVPRIDVNAVAAADPLFGPNIQPGAGAHKLRHIPLSAARQADSLIRPHR